MELTSRRASTLQRRPRKHHSSVDDADVRNARDLRFCEIRATPRACRIRNQPRVHLPPCLSHVLLRRAILIRWQTICHQPSASEQISTSLVVSHLLLHWRLGLTIEPAPDEWLRPIVHEHWLRGENDKEMLSAIQSRITQEHGREYGLGYVLVFDSLR